MFTGSITLAVQIMHSKLISDTRYSVIFSFLDESFDGLEDSYTAI